jgi:uncharacterized phiE125 gp8 family phage protein
VWSLNLISEPALEPLDLETEVYPHLRLEPELTPQEPLIKLAITAARYRCEAFTQRQLITATWELWLDGWYDTACYQCGRIYLPRPPLQLQSPAPPATPTAGVLSVMYVDTAGIAQTLPTDQYVVDAPQGAWAGQGSIFAPYAVIWPTVQYQPGAVRIRYTAGYGADYRNIPAALRQGMLLTVGQLDANREEQATGTSVDSNMLRAEQLWFPFRVAW